MVRTLRRFPDISSYLEGFPRILEESPRDCPRCGKKGVLIGNGTYRRWHITFGFRARVRIQRLLCPVCNHTVALIPHFMRERSPYAKEVVAAVRTARARGRPLFALPAALLERGVVVKYATIRSWAAQAA